MIDFFGHTLGWLAVHVIGPPVRMVTTYPLLALVLAGVALVIAAVATVRARRSRSCRGAK